MWQIRHVVGVLFGGKVGAARASRATTQVAVSSRGPLPLQMAGRRRARMHVTHNAGLDLPKSECPGSPAVNRHPHVNSLLSPPQRLRGAQNAPGGPRAARLHTRPICTKTTTVPPQCHHMHAAPRSPCCPLVGATLNQSECVMHGGCSRAAVQSPCRRRVHKPSLR